MFGNFFSFQSKNKEGKPPKEENSKKNNNKKRKENKKDGTEAATEENHKENVQVIKDEEEQFEEVRGNSSNVDHTDVSTISNDVSEHQNGQHHLNDEYRNDEYQNEQLNRNDQHRNDQYRNGEHRNGDGMVPSVPELLQQLQQVENEARRLADGLEQVRKVSVVEKTSSSGDGGHSGMLILDWALSKLKKPPLVIVLLRFLLTNNE